MDDTKCIRHSGRDPDADRKYELQEKGTEIEHLLLTYEKGDICESDRSRKYSFTIDLLCNKDVKDAPIISDITGKGTCSPSV